MWFLVLLLAGIGAFVLAPIAAATAVVMAVGKMLDWRLARRRRRLARIPRAAAPVVVTLAPGRDLSDALGPLCVRAPIRTWGATSIDRFRRLEFDAHGVVVDELDAGGYRKALRRRSLVPVPGSDRIELFLGGRWRVERALADVYVTRADWRLLAFLAFGAAACTVLAWVANVIEPFGWG